MKVYLASWFSSKDDMRIRANELIENGIEVTSRWIDEAIDGKTHVKDVSKDYLRETAMIDLHDIIMANVLVLQVPSEEQLATSDIPLASWARGGRHFESGFQYATMMFYRYLPIRIQSRGSRQLVLVGHRENVFHYLDGLKEIQADGFELPEILIFETWDLAKAYLIEVSKGEGVPRSLSVI